VRNQARGMRTTAMVLAAVLVAAAEVMTLGVGSADGSKDRSHLSGPNLTVRVNQVGYSTAASKVGFAMVRSRRRSISFELLNTHGKVELRGSSSDDVGSWNNNYKAVYRLNFSKLHKAGTYKLEVLGSDEASSPAFRVSSASAIYRRLVTNGVRYFTSERDGGDVRHSVLKREPANLTDRRATVYADPRYNGNDLLLTEKFRRVAGPVNVSGGWFDAGGGYEKFAYTASYADALLLIAERENKGRYPTLSPEADFGLSWLERLYNPRKKVLYAQVGIGDGNNQIAGDYNYWFLPQAEDRIHTRHGDTDYYVKYRPVFEAAAPGHKISPDLAGRFAAAFALGAQLKAHSDPAQARHLLSLARSVFALAQTHDVHSIITAFPHAYYPGSEWKSDMLWGGTEIALADKALNVDATRSDADLKTAGYWAEQYIRQGHSAGGDTFNLYDNGAVAEGELLQAQRELGNHSGVNAKQLLGDLAAQLRVGEGNAKGDPFQLGTQIGPNDATPHAFGLYITNAIYQHYGGSSRYASFAQQQLNFNLGANPWGSSFVVGAGTTFPHCLQSEIANVAGSLSGRGVIQLGAVGDGPSSPSNFKDLGTVQGMRACSAGQFAPYNNRQAAYEDNVEAWPSVEPADDYAAASVLAFAIAGSHS
jgi:endoglucanase